MTFNGHVATRKPPSSHRRSPNARKFCFSIQSLSKPTTSTDVCLCVFLSAFSETIGIRNSGFVEWRHVDRVETLRPSRWIGSDSSSSHVTSQATSRAGIPQIAWISAHNYATRVLRLTNAR